MDAMTSELIIVAGMARCGTSLTMQMIDACGLKCAGKYPAFEDIEHGLNYGDWMTDYDAVKALDPQADYSQFSWRRPAKVVWLDRELEEQAKSGIKLAQVSQLLHGMRTHKPSKPELRDYVRSLKKSRKKAMRLFADARFNLHICKFERLIAGDIDELADFLELDADIMRSQIIPRGPECQQSLAIETTLIERDLS